LGQAGWLNPSVTGRKVRRGGKIHQFLWRRSRAVSVAKQELRDKGR
jgi:hypothetical protein